MTLHLELFYFYLKPIEVSVIYFVDTDLKIVSVAEVYLASCQTSMMELFAKRCNINAFFIRNAFFQLSLSVA